MPHINDLSQGVIWEGNNGDKWVVEESISTEGEIMPRLKKLKVVEELIREE